MSDTRSRTGILVGFAAAVGAFGAAAMMSASAAPTAHADDYSDIISAIDGDFTDGQVSFTTAFTDFGSSDLSPGLAAFFSGVDDDLLSPGINTYVGTVEALTNEPISDSFPWDIPLAANFTDAVSESQALFGIGESLLGEVATALSSGDYGQAAIDQAVGSDYVFIFPLEELLVGAAASF